MKTEHPIRIDRARAKDPLGGAWNALDSVAQGLVQILEAPRSPIAQAQVAMMELLRLAALSPNWDWSTCAVIAREWKYLDPVRAFCEVHRIPAQMGNEEIPRFCRLRETQALVEWLRGRKTRLVDVADLRAWVDARSPGPWIELLQEALDEHALETGGAEIPVDHFIEWLAEWGRDIRRRQRGLLLLTAHRAKGLEFDHVAVLDGGWDKVGQGEDPDAPRRLYYVAMTRARQTLALARFEESHPLQDALLGISAMLRRQSPVNLPPETPELARQYRRPSLGEIGLGFAGRHRVGDPVHRAIAALSPGDPLEARMNEQGRWELMNQSGTVVGRLANNFRPPHGTRCSSATVLAIVVWGLEASAPQYKDSAKCDTWEVVVPELVFDL